MKAAKQKVKSAKPITSSHELVSAIISTFPETLVQKFSSNFPFEQLYTRNHNFKTSISKSQDNHHLF